MLEKNLVKHAKFFYRPEISFHQLFYRELGIIAITKLGGDFPLIVKEQAVFASVGQKM